MSARDHILEQIKINKPAELVLPETLSFESDFADLTETFTELLKTVYTEVVPVKNETELLQLLTARYEGVVNRATTIPSLLPWADFSLSVSDPHELETLELAVLKAEFGVAENGAIWISDAHLPHRVLPFITQNLALVIPAQNLVGNMHEAYKRLTDTTGWGCFISGPSKTADIEQSLVIGAHGSRSLVVYLLEE
ncbi:L-lactate dehydrogenase complex protein LldG [Dyadobacter jejuensis]|uniref:L-lactate dehydrogenase complex protein LldG n=1 Tax=Dyadobacter jejuensis TaxID=1082580 RepID=A0A316ANN8_9BACT|nr:LUD domain-containing protein [Dyadobacter jejuensis]PWJ58400.1 L-lactate dehydrogenase complex protein LldG [Dyadobacter jejuensis]